MTLCGAVAVGCAAPEAPIDVRFTVEDTADGGRTTIRNLQFFIHEAALLGSDGNDYPLRPIAAAPWQNGEVALIDLSGAPGSPRNAVLRGVLSSRPAAELTGIRFVVGVPFALNHANPLTATAPLDRSDLFWTWQGGYKFLQADLSEDGQEWSFHLGSTGCASASAVRPPSAECAEPNRITVEIRDLDPLRDGVEFRLSELVDAMRAADYEICVGNYAALPACREPFARTGLADGADAQRLFGPGR